MPAKMEGHVAASALQHWATQQDEPWRLHHQQDMGSEHMVPSTRHRAETLGTATAAAVGSRSQQGMSAACPVAYPVECLDACV